MKRINYFSEHPPEESPDSDIILIPQCEYCLSAFVQGIAVNTFCSLRKQHPERCVLDQGSIFKENDYET